MVPIPDLVAKQIQAADKLPFKQRIEELMRAKDAVLPREAQGPIFEIGEGIVLKGGRFRVESFEDGRLVLKGVPQ
jgi:hypothetical protein